MWMMVSSATGNRRFLKAKRRLYNYIHNLQQACNEVLDFENAEFEGVIISFVDQHYDYLLEVPNRDRVYQVEVGMDQEGLSFRSEDDEKLLARMSPQIRKALMNSPFSDHDKAILLELHQKWHDRYVED